MFVISSPDEFLVTRLNFRHFAFWSPLTDTVSTYTVHRRLIGKRVVDFLLVLIELFLLGVTADVLRAKIDCKSASCKGVGHILQIFT